jgi:GWxTD domain-containing protein
MSMEMLGRYSRSLETAEPSASGDTAAVSIGGDASSRALVFSMLRRSGAMWTDEKLLSNGLYHIAPLEDVAFYLMLEHDWDRKEWWRKFWAPRDPTPTTDENEAEAAFIKRVQYAYSHFGRDWEKQGIEYPPWDARGELYIRFGEPDRREERDEGCEEWTYYRYRVNFKVSARDHNADGCGIKLAAVSRYLYRNNARAKAYMLGKPAFYYADPFLESIENIKGLEFRLESTRPAGVQMQLRFLYRLPVFNFKLKDTGGRLAGACKGRWVVYDEDYRKVAFDEFIREIQLEDKREYGRRTLSGTIDVTLPPGSYEMALRLEDPASNRLGIYRKGFTVKSKNGKEES